MLGRVALLDTGPRISTAHNFGLAPPLEHWEDFVEFESTPFALFDPAGDLVCDGLLSDCVAGVREVETHAMVRAVVAQDPRARARVEPTATGSAVPKEATLLERDYGPYRIHSDAPFAQAFSNYTLRIRESPPARISALSKQALFWLKVNGGTSNVIVLHVRRGDKASLPGLNASTSPANILKILHALALPGTATVYIMTNEWHKPFFDAVRKEYTVFQWDDIPSLRALLATCPLPDDGRPASPSLHDEDDLLPAAATARPVCDSITLYSVEEMLMTLVQPSRRVVTFLDDVDFRWRPGNMVPYLHPAGEWAPPTHRRWCKRIGEPCTFHSHCCSARCRRGGDGQPLQCFEWYPSPQLVQS